MDFAEYASDAITSQLTTGALATAAYLGSKMAKKYRSSPVTSTTALAKQNAYKIRRISKQVRLNTGELHMIQNSTSTTIPTLSVVSAELTAINTGDDYNQRSGRNIRVRGLNIRTHVSNSADVDVYILLSPNGLAAPAYTDFVNVRGGFIGANLKDDYKELAFLKNTDASNPYWGMYNKKLNIVTKYNGSGSTTGVMNRIYLVFVNRGATSQTVDYCSKTYFNAD